MAAQPNTPIIVKRKKVIQGGHHGGAWKVAYADFVTAMMAFFLLMWLLGATSEKQRKGIADFFNPTIPINKTSGGGDGAFNGDSIFTENTLAQSGTGTGLTMTSQPNAAKGDNGLSLDRKEAGAEKDDELAAIESKLTGRSGESMVSELLQRHIVTRLTDEGLVVEVFDIPDAPLFRNTARPTPVLLDVLGSIAQVFRLSANEIAVHGHVSSVPLVSRENPVWELSTERADAARRTLIDYGLGEERMQRMTGYADRKPVVSDPLSIRNNRLEIILLRDRI